jgi:hypothetical protein
MIGLTNLESLISTLIGFYTRRGYNGSVVTESAFKPLSTTSIPAQLVYISNTSGENLFVSTDNGSTYLSIPNGAIFPFNNIHNLNAVWVKTEGDTPGVTITYRYEV